jgi:hypothetical protein
MQNISPKQTPIKKPQLLWGLILLLMCSDLFALGGTDGFSAVPSAGVLPHTAYQIFGQVGWHRIREKPQQEASSVIPWMTGIRMGLFDRGEFGVELGDKVSLSGKMQFVREEDWIPSWSFGARQVFHSQEAHFYSVPDSMQDPFAGELFMVVSKTFFRNTLLNGGVSVIPGLDSGKAQPFWGVSQKLSSVVELIYDGFYRHEDLHHNAGLGLLFGDVLRISLGASEVDRFFYQNEEFGFYLRDRENSALGAYRTPGFYFMISVTGFMKEGMRANTQDRVAVLEKRIENHAKRIEQTEQRADRVELQVKSLQGGGTDSVTIREAEAERMLAELVRSMQNESWDPKESRRLQDSLLALGEVSSRMLVRTALRESSLPDYRLTSIRVMGASASVRYHQTLLDLLIQEDPELNREAFYALLKIGTPEVMESLRTYRNRCSPEIQKMMDGLKP